MTKKTNDGEIQRLNDFSHSRLRTEMYLSSRDPHTQVVIEYDKGVPVARETIWVPALFTAYREVVDNAIDELVTHRAGDQIDIGYNPKTMTFTVADNGRGIPIGFNDAEKMHEATLALTVKQAGRNFSDDRGATRGLNGVGASVVNYCSEYFQLDICRDKKTFTQRFSEGAADLVIDDPIILPAPPKQSTGTRIEFKLSKKVFKHMKLPESFIRSRAFELALCYPELKVTYNGEKIVAKGGPEKVLFAGKTKPIAFEINKDAFKSRFWLMPGFFDDGSEHTHGMVNSIPVFSGGVHIDTFKRLFFSGLITALERESKKRRLTPNRSDFVDGMLVYNITEMNAPSFDSQSKTRLINEDVGKIVASAMDDPEFFKGVIAKNRDWIDAVYQRCAERTQKKENADLAKLARAAKRTKVEKLEDASGMNRQKCVLFLAEGDSAVSGITDARDAEIHGALPLRGKVLNVHPSKVKSLKTVMENDVLAGIMNSIGLIPGQRANRHALRYGKVSITCDADEDGKNIAALLINFFYQLWPELFDPASPFIYVFDTPLIIAVKGKERRYWFNDDYAEFDADAHKGWDITRAKGLAALKRPDWKHALAAPKERPIVEDGRLKDSLNLLFDETKADDRKDWLGIAA